MIWNEARECMSRDELADLQGKRLVGLVEYMYHNVGYYSKKMKALGMEPGDIRGIEDLNKLPFTTKEDLLDAYPIGVFAVPDSKIVRYHASDNVAGIGTVTGYTQNDLDVWSECVARSIGMAGLSKNDVIQIAYSYDMYANGLGAHYGAEKVGAAVIPASVSKIPELVTMMRKLHVTGIMSAPSYLMRVAQTVEQRGMGNTLQLKAAICGGEPWSEKTRKTIQEKLGIKVYDIFGLNELIGLGVAGECECQNGMHVQEDFFLPEILDIHTLLSAADGVSGELVFTALQKEGIPLIRFRTMNMTKIHYGKCECGRTTARIDRICKRTDDILLIRGNIVYMHRIEAAFSELPDMDAAYSVYIRKELDLDVVDVYMDSDKLNGTLMSGNEISIKNQVADVLYNVIGVMPRVHLAESDRMKAPNGRKVTIVDEREFF
ncbi:MAG: phenylacetate--CoA ligase [Lachnospiraceae bacterium]|nr:phenylacetate--CoA ligase [Lachnospiraceae bacterium]